MSFPGQPLYLRKPLKMLLKFDSMQMREEKYFELDVQLCFFLKVHHILKVHVKLLSMNYDLSKSEFN